MTDTRMVVGLGNPGKEYEKTRHNVGFDVVDELAEKLGIDTRQTKFAAKFGTGCFAGKKLILLKPWTFMNRSGQSVATAAGFYKLDPQDVLVVFDDMALESGLLRIRKQGSAGGHNGLADILQKMGTQQVPRLRVGIGQSRHGDAVNHVLGRFTDEELPVIEQAVKDAADAVLYWIENDANAAMNKFNQRQQDQQ